MTTSIYQTEQMRSLENLALTQFQLDGHTLMQRAGKAAFDDLLKRWPHAQHITVMCGSGNNGGDGYVLANLAQQQGLQVKIFQMGKPENMPPEARAAYETCEKNAIAIETFHSTSELTTTDVIVDAICGIGLNTDLRTDTVIAIEKMRVNGAPIYSLDIPTGINADTGSVLGHAVPATATITFIGLKLGLLTGDGVSYSGELSVNDLQLPAELFAKVTPTAELLELSDYLHYLQPRAKNWHKGLSGHVLIVGGDHGFSGAPRMAAEAALRVGAGLVTVATQPANAVEMNLSCPEIMCKGITTVDDLSPLLEKASVIVIGPGLGQSAWSRMVWGAVIQSQLPMVVDADGLNLLAQTTLRNQNWILTPHPGEAARLLQQTTATIQHDRLMALRTLQTTYAGVCVLKGAGSLVLAPGANPALCDKGNPGMATAGMGDVLSGVIGGLLGQKVPLGDAAKLGVLLHALAGDLAAKEGGERGLIAMDLMPYLRHMSNIWPPI